MERIYPDRERRNPDASTINKFLDETGYTAEDLVTIARNLSDIWSDVALDTATRPDETQDEVVLDNTLKLIAFAKGQRDERGNVPLASTRTNIRKLSLPEVKALLALNTSWQKKDGALLIEAQRQLRELYPPKDMDTQPKSLADAPK